MLRVFLVLLPLLTAGRALREGECEVCLKVIDKFSAAAKKAGAKKSNAIEKVIQKECKKFKDSKETRMCYYIGGTDDAATRMLQSVSKPMSHHLPSSKICQKLKKKDSAICELRYEKPIDLEGKDIGKMRVKQLKKILSTWGEKCNGCTEKRDFVKLVEKLKPKYAPSKEDRDEL